MDTQDFQHLLSNILLNHTMHPTSGSPSQQPHTDVSSDVPSTPPPPYSDVCIPKRENAVPQAECEEGDTVHIDATTVIQGHGNIINIESLRATVAKLASEFACLPRQPESLTNMRPTPTTSSLPSMDDTLAAPSSENFVDEAGRVRQAAGSTFSTAQRMGRPRAIQIKIECGLRVSGERNLVGCAVRPILVARANNEDQRMASQQVDSTTRSKQPGTNHGPVTRAAKRKAERDVADMQSGDNSKRTKSAKS